MQTVKKKVRNNTKPEWRIILENLVYRDQITIYRICRKMIIYLNRREIPEIKEYIQPFFPTPEIENNSQKLGHNWPKPKGIPFAAEKIIGDVFTIADRYLEDEEINSLLSYWLHQEQINELSLVLERRHSPLKDVIDAVKKYLRYFNPEKISSFDEIIGLRVGLIHRFLSENLDYIGIAKKYISIREMDKILDRTIGPANGNGKLGGKSAGLILARQILSKKGKEKKIYKKVSTPRSRFLTSDALFEFLHYNALEEFVFLKYQNPDEIRQEYTFLEYIFKNSSLPPETVQALNSVLDDFEGKPIIVRSSSLLEDSFKAAFSGKYKSLFISNLGTKSERLASLLNAIVEVYASSFGPDPIEYRKERDLIDFREEMGILIQQVVGNKIGKYFLPSYAGVAFSNNEMRWSPRLERKDGIVRLVVGLGTRAVDRTIDDYPILVSPGKPDLKINQSYEDQVRFSQQYIDVINLETNNFETLRFSDFVKEIKAQIPGIEKIVSYDRHRALVNPIGPMDDFLKEDLIVTFNGLIHNSDFIPTIKEILTDLEEAFGAAVDVEFASDGNKLYILQCRPQTKFKDNFYVELPQVVNKENIIFTSSKYVNSGLIKDIEYVVYIDGNGYQALESIDDMKLIAKIVGRLNHILPRRKFILIGPGRWGSKGDIKLGVPVIYSDINNAALLIEQAISTGGYIPELSFGTHFFQDLVESDIKYLPLYPDDKENIFNKAFFNNSYNSMIDIFPEYRRLEKVVKIIKVDMIKPKYCLNVYMDGEENKAIAVLEPYARS